MPDAEDDAKRDPVWMSSAMLKAYTHPLRRQILKLMTRRVHLRAADIAAELDVAPNSASFHLRTLADAGLIVEAPEQARDRRDRVWTPVRGALNLGDPDNPVADEGLAGAMMQLIFAEHQELVRRLIAWTPEFVAGRDTEMHGVFQQRTIRLTSDEFVALLKAIDTATAAADEAHDPEDPEGRFWEINLLAADDMI